MDRCSNEKVPRLVPIGQGRAPDNEAELHMHPTTARTPMVRELELGLSPASQTASPDASRPGDAMNAALETC